MVGMDGWEDYDDDPTCARPSRRRDSSTRRRSRDLLQLFQAAHAEIRAASGVRQLGGDDFTLRKLVMAVAQVDLALRPSDVACIPACNFRTEPTHLEW